MSKFFVGQRVRIKWSNGWPDLAGSEGSIIAVAQNGGATGTSEWIVAPDAWGDEVAKTPSEMGAWVFAPHSSQLEPLTDSYDKTDWAECAWQPDHLKEAA